MSALKRIYRKILRVFWTRLEVPMSETMVGELSQSNSMRARLERYDSDLLERVQVFWRLGQWESIVTQEISDIQLNPDRAKIALLIASAHLQLGNLDEGKSLLQFSRENGCPDGLIAKVLAAGIHNSLGIAAMAAGDESLTIKHLSLAIGADFTPEERSPLTNFRSTAENERQRKRASQDSAIVYRS